MHTRRPLSQLLRSLVIRLDLPLLWLLLILLTISLINMYSAGYALPGRFFDHLRNIVIALAVMWLVAHTPPQTLMRLALPMYIAGLLLLIAVALFGDVSKGARRWLHLGVARIQPSELMKIAMPLMLAWYFHMRETTLRPRHYLVATLLLILPVGLIVRQPDLGTALLVLAAGFYVIFLAGLHWKILLGVLAAALGSLPLVWSMMHDYQRERILTLLNPSNDPLGKGFHTIQSMIAIGSGGFTGKGWLEGSQAHLEFIPEHTTDFVLAVYSEEFGLLGNLVLLGVYLAIIFRGVTIAANAANFFSRLLAGAITLTFFTYAFVNIGMVSGILPVVGVPLPFMSYGGTAMLTLGVAMGILMSIHRHRKLVQT
ncbi:MAG: rod shape-determining protein RodA [Burkholderiaceae bacterium]|nr:MAG: rod shape-determining protein RodA [Burkholderiaceae bacterium]